MKSVGPCRGWSQTTFYPSRPTNREPFRAGPTLSSEVDLNHRLPMYQIGTLTGLSYRRLVRVGGLDSPCTSTLPTVYKAEGIHADCAPPEGSGTIRPVRRSPPLLSYLAPTWG